MAESCPPEHGNAWLRNGGFDGQGLQWHVAALPPVFVSPKPTGGTPMGGAVGDLNGDGLLDYALSEIGLRALRANGTDLRRAKGKDLAAAADSANHLLVAKAGGGFDSVGPQAGIAAALSSTGQSMVSWSTAFVDLDFDGHLDLLISHGHDWDSFLVGDQGGMRPVLFRNRGDGTFEDVTLSVGAEMGRWAWGALFVDLDNDGWQDLFVPNGFVTNRRTDDL